MRCSPVDKRRSDIDAILIGFGDVMADIPAVVFWIFVSFFLTASLEVLFFLYYVVAIAAYLLILFRYVGGFPDEDKAVPEPNCSILATEFELMSEFV